MGTCLFCEGHTEDVRSLEAHKPCYACTTVSLLGQVAANTNTPQLFESPHELPLLVEEEGCQKIQTPMRADFVLPVNPLTQRAKPDRLPVMSHSRLGTLGSVSGVHAVLNAGVLMA
jgi:hypothetical protein